MITFAEELDKNQEGFGILDRYTRIFALVNAQLISRKELGKESQRYFPLKKVEFTLAAGSTQIPICLCFTHLLKSLLFTFSSEIFIN